MKIKFNVLSQTYSSKENAKALDVEDLIKKRIQRLNDYINKVTDSFMSRDIQSDTWESMYFKELSSAHIQMYLLGIGGLKLLELSDKAFILKILEDQAYYLDRFKQKLKEQKSVRYISNRNSYFANSIRGSYEKSKQLAHIRAGYRYEKRIRNATESCLPCIFYSSLDWVTIGTLPPPMSKCTCKVNCKCTTIYKRETNEPRFFNTPNLSVGFGRERFQRTYRISRKHF